MSEIGWRLCEIQKAKGFTQAQFAEALDVGLSSMRNYLTANRVPGVDLIVNICVELSVSPDWLVLGKGSMFYGEEFGETMSLDRKHEIFGILGKLNHKRAFLGQRVLELLEEIHDLDRSDEAVAMLQSGRITIDQFSESMRQIEEEELGLFALFALKAIADYLRTYTRAAKAPQPVLPSSVTEIVRRAAKSGPNVVEAMAEKTTRLRDEWKTLTTPQ